MAKLLILIAIMFLACGCDQREPQPPVRVRKSTSNTSMPASDLPVVPVDAVHAMRETDPAMSDRPYTAKASRGLRLEIDSFQPSDPQRLGRQINAVRILYDGSEYSVALPEGIDKGASCDLVSSSMKVVRGAPFAGFSAGKEAAIGIGYEDLERQSGAAPFKEFWVAKVIFTP